MKDGVQTYLEFLDGKRWCSMSTLSVSQHKEGWLLQVIPKNFFVNNDKTLTVFHESHIPLKIWFLVLYLYLVIWPGCSIRDIVWGSSTISKMLSIHRTVMKKISSSFHSTKFDGHAEENDEFYIKIGLKDKSYHNEIPIRKKTQEERLKSCRDRCTFYKDLPMITCIFQSKLNDIFWWSCALVKSWYCL